MGFTVFGGQLRPAISLSISGKLPVSDEEVSRNIENASGLGLPSYKEILATRPHLAVVGGGPSINQHVEKLQKWDGDVWAINGAWKWCKERGINATFFAVDPHPIVLSWAQGVTNAILETRCDPSVFKYLKDAQIHLIDIGLEKHEIKSGGSAATAVPYLAMKMGYRGVTFFGCESCYSLDSTHAYFREEREEEMLVECGGFEYLTAPDFYMQAQELSMLLKAAPEFLREESGGLLTAMIDNDDYLIKWISDGLARNISQN